MKRNFETFPVDYLAGYASVYRRWLLICAVLSVLLVAPGCDDDKKVEPSKLVLSGDDVRCGALNKPLDKPIQLFMEGKKEPTFLGGSSTPHAAGVKVVFRIAMKPDEASPELSVSEAVTDAGGSVKTSFSVGARPGVYMVVASCPDFPKIKPVTIVILGGITLIGDRQDGSVGGRLDEPVRVRIEAAPGIYKENAIVEFDVRKCPKGASPRHRELMSDGDGFATFDLEKIGKKQGSGEIGINFIQSPLGQDASRYTLKARFFVIDHTSLIVSVLGGLAVFIFGMKLMSEGLSLVAGEKLRSLLNFLTNNRFAAVGVGLTVTGLIQSSSACTVMVIGFVNAGLMRLEQAIGVIMGSNIGTTVTAQMISFKLDTLALPAITIGVIVSLLAKKSRTRFVAQIMIGFGILFLGMGMMSKPLKELQDSETIKSLFEGLNCMPVSGSIPFFNVIKAVAAGTLLTVIVQSSSASIGLLLALSGAGLLDIYTAFAILLGDNIGTTITAILASIGSSRAAKRAACAHCLFNVMGTTIMVFLFFVDWPATGRPVFMEFVNYMTAGNNFAGENLTRFLANAHTIFNMSCTVLFIGFVSVFARICRIVVPGEDVITPEQEAKRFLDPRLLATPSIAIQQTWYNIDYMLSESREAHLESFKAMEGTDDPDWDKIAESVKAHEKDIDRLQTEITEYLSEISMEALTESQSSMLPRLLHTVNDIERIGDHSMRMLRQAKRVRKRALPFTTDAMANIKEMFVGIEKLFAVCSNSIKAAHGLGEADRGADCAALRKLLEEAKQCAKAIKKQGSDFRKAHEARHECGDCDIRSGVVFMDVILNLTRTSGHLLNVVEATMPDEVLKQ